MMADETIFLAGYHKAGWGAGPKTSWAALGHSAREI